MVFNMLHAMLDSYISLNVYNFEGRKETINFLRQTLLSAVTL